ncbi:hydroxymethylbilane synthase [Adhaeretor mobilis]|uniref:Porphobilinogen deaminase n=1 Tax=Adhaeretor mobilis TaxID=1930276 RepID=A0A517MTW0_9BACT|nr:hydroxymethylbilane synthase [Adhaeretor mobilis]QDS98313.1 Porphobilinogen deaminase [Adhaeretor mobilis]
MSASLFQSDSPLRIGTRASKLARWQSDWVAAELKKHGHAAEIVEISTQGDTQQSGSVASLGLQGVFTKEIQSALLAGEVDIAVHSLKDLPTETIAGLRLAAVPRRANPADALVSSAGRLSELPAGAKIGTGSTRRQAQLLAARHDLNVVGIRGNVDTRLRKLDDGEYDAIVLAAAGLTRLGWKDRITELLNPPTMLPAPGQGALGLECRADDEGVIAALSLLDHEETHRATTAERTMLAVLDGGCSAPIAAWGRLEMDDDEQPQLKLDGLVASLDGTEVLRASTSGRPGQAEELGRIAAEQLLDLGAADIIRDARVSD